MIPHEFDVMCLWIGRVVAWIALSVGAVCAVWLAVLIAWRLTYKVLNFLKTFHLVYLFARMPKAEKAALKELAKDYPGFRCQCGHGRHTHLSEIGRCVACSCKKWVLRR